MKEKNEEGIYVKNPIDDYMDSKLKVFSDPFASANNTVQKKSDVRILSYNFGQSKSEGKKANTQ